ncbi:MAG: hypothetical protein ACLFQB_04310 [Chitinispirillaceae bacterium]
MTNKSLVILILFLSVLFNADAQNGSDTLGDQTNTPVLPADSLSQKPKAPQGMLLGAGVGFSIGSIPLFTLWQKSLPDSLDHLGLDPQSGTIMPDSSNSIEADTNQLSYEITEEPEVYNITLPIYLTAMHVEEDRMISVGASFLYTSKQFQTSVYPEPDTLDRRVNIREKMNFYSLALELAYKKAIPPQYFSIDGTDRAFFTAALSLSPLCAFTKESSASTSIPAEDLRMHALRDTIQSRLTPLSSFGAALSWQFGISTLKHSSNGGGLEIGLQYSGSWHSLFSNEGSKVLNRDIYYRAPKANKPLSFISSRIELKVSVFRALGDDQKEPAL